jgi:hypothetical protein
VVPCAARLGAKRPGEWLRRSNDSICNKTKRFQPKAAIAKHTEGVEEARAMDEVGVIGEIEESGDESVGRSL